MSIHPQNHGTMMSDLVLDAYTRLSHEQLVLFLAVRSLPTNGDDKELAARLATHDFRTYTFPCNDDLRNVAPGHHALDADEKDAPEMSRPGGSLVTKEEELDERRRQRLAEITIERKKEQKRWDEDAMRLRHRNDRVMAGFLQTKTLPVLV